MTLLRTVILIFLTLQTLFGKTLSLQEAIDATLLTHPDAKLALYQLNMAYETLGITKAATYPELSVNAEYYPSKTLVSQNNGNFVTRDHFSTHLDVTMTYTLWDFGRTQKRINAAQQDAESALALNENAKALLGEKVWQAYYSLAYLQRVNTANALSLAFYQALYDQSRQMKTVGLKTEADSERFYASLLDAKDLLETSRNEERKYTHLLSMLTGFLEQDIRIEDDFTALSHTTLPSFPDTKWRQMLKEYNAELEALGAKIKQSQSLYESSKAENYGTILFAGSLGSDTSISSYSSNQIGIKASIPLLTGGRISHQIEKDRVGILVAEEALRARELTLWQELYEAILDTKRLDTTIEAKQMAAQALSKTVAITQGRYKEGLATYIEVLEAQHAYDNATIAQSAAMLQKIASLAHIKRLIPKGASL